MAVTQRILDVATDQVSTRRQFGRPIGANQSVRFRLAEGFAEVAGARALIAAAWEDGSPDASVWAKAVAGVTHDSCPSTPCRCAAPSAFPTSTRCRGSSVEGSRWTRCWGARTERDVHFGDGRPRTGRAVLTRRGAIRVWRMRPAAGKGTT